MGSTPTGSTISMTVKNKVATIERVLAVNPIPGADAIEVASVLGWKVVVKKGQFKPGDWCVYIAIDSIVNKDLPQYKFLEKVNYRIRTVRLRGQISQGLCLPLSDFGLEGRGDIGDDVSAIVGAEHYEAPLPPELAGNAKGFLPDFLKRTDEINLKGLPALLTEFEGKGVYITTKYDGTSSTYYTRDGQFGFCGRNVEFKEDTVNTFSRIVEKYDIKNKMLKLGFNIAIQGEVVGPGIQGNNLGLKEHELVLFSLFNIDKHEYLGHHDLLDVARALDIRTAETIYSGPFKFTIADLQKIANELKYPNGKPAEGIVIRPIVQEYSPLLGGHLSAKIISETFDMAK